MKDKNGDIDIVSELEEEKIKNASTADDNDEMENPRYQVFSITTKIETKLIDDLDDYLNSSHSASDFTFKTRASILRHIIKNIKKIHIKRDDSDTRKMKARLSTGIQVNDKLKKTWDSITRGNNTRSKYYRGTKSELMEEGIKQFLTKNKKIE